MHVTASVADITFKDDFEAGRIPTSEFSHRNHLRLVFTYLCESDVDTSTNRMRAALKHFLHVNSVPAAKYHETITTSWVMAVRHFMELCPQGDCFDTFLAADERLMDPEIMLSHYKRDTLFSDTARQAFIEPDISPIPQYG